MGTEFISFEDNRWRDVSKALPEDVQAEVSGELAPPGGCLLLAYDPDAEKPVLGCAGFRRVDRETCEARRVVVQWDEQKRGLGKTLMDALLAEAAGRGYQRMIARVPRHVQALVAFYGRRGFTRFDEDDEDISFEIALG